MMKNLNTCRLPRDLVQLVSVTSFAESCPTLAVTPQSFSPVVHTFLFAALHTQIKPLMS